MIRLTASDEWIEIKDEIIYTHRPEWSDPKVLIKLPKLEPKPGFEYWGKAGYDFSQVQLNLDMV